jgi:hypothetical protein
MNTITPKKWAHSWDIWGTVIEKETAGQRERARYVTFSRKLGVSEAEIARNLAMYEKAMSGTVSGDEKSRLLEPVNSAVERLFADNEEFREASVRDMSPLFYEDAIKSMRTIIESGENVALFTSANSSSVNETFRRKFPDLAEKIGQPYTWGKSLKGFKRLDRELRAKGLTPATHTEDEFKYVETAAESQVYPCGIVFVDRKNTKSPAERVKLLERNIIAVQGLTGMNYRTITRGF